MASSREGAATRYGAVRETTAGSATAAARSAATRSLIPARPTKSIANAETTSPNPPPLLWVINQPHRIATAPPSPIARIEIDSTRREASATAGQKPMRKSAASPFEYEIGYAR